MVLSFKDWLILESHAKPAKELSQLSKFRAFPGDLYRTNLFPLFAKYRGSWGKMEINKWFMTFQQQDNAFYTMVQCDHIGQPDVRELWRDLTERPSAKANLATPMQNNI